MDKEMDIEMDNWTWAKCLSSDKSHVIEDNESSFITSLVEALNK